MLRVAHSLERPMLVALLVLVGASWRGASFSFAVFGLLTIGRTLAALIVGEVVMRSARRRRQAPRLPGFGFGLLPQGELALGLLVAIVSFFPDTAGVLEAVVAAIVVNNLIGGWWIRGRLDQRSHDGIDS
jgi:hypothetical protein